MIKMKLFAGQERKRSRREKTCGHGRVRGELGDGD